MIAAALWMPRLQRPARSALRCGCVLLLGTSLAEGKGYRLLNEPGAIQAVQYPPVLPLVAAAPAAPTRYHRSCGRWPLAPHLLVPLFLVYAVATFLLGHRFLPTGSPFSSALLAVLHVQTLFMSDYFATDVPYALVSSLFFLTGGGAAAAVMAVIAFGLRTAGVALLGAWVAEGVAHRQYRKAALRTVVTLAAVGGWMVYTTSVKAGPTTIILPTATSEQTTSITTSDTLKTCTTSIPSHRNWAGHRKDWIRRLTANLAHMPASLGEAASLNRGWWRGEANRIEERIPGPVIPDRPIEVALASLSMRSSAESCCWPWIGTGWSCSTSWDPSC